jgi:hypothetical protein
MNDNRFGDVDAVCARTLTRGPREDARVLGFVPQIGLEDLQAAERGEMVGEQTPCQKRRYADAAPPSPVTAVTPHEPGPPADCQR